MPTGKVYDREAGNHYLCPRGAYTPTVGAVTLTNLDSQPTVTNAQYGVDAPGYTLVQGVAAAIDPTATGNIEFDIPLPVASDLAAGDLYGGLTQVGSNATERPRRMSRTTRTLVSVVATGTGLFQMQFWFRYRVK